MIRGPFGAPSQQYTHFKTTVLIGMGIGITPMLSIMRDTLHRLAKLPREMSQLKVGSPSWALL
jgi:respiratory burst oxidase